MNTPYKISYYIGDNYYERYYRTEKVMIRAYFYLQTIPGIRFLRKEVIYDD